MNAFSALALLLTLIAAADDAHVARWLEDRTVRPVPSDAEVAGFLTRRSYEENLARQAEERERLARVADKVQGKPDANNTPPLRVTPLRAEPLATIEPVTLRAIEIPQLPPLPVLRLDGESDDQFIARAQAAAAVQGERSARETLDRAEAARSDPARQATVERRGVEQRARGLTGLFQRLFRPVDPDAASSFGGAPASYGAGSSPGAGGAGASGSGGARRGAPAGSIPSSPPAAMSMGELQIAAAGGMGQPFRDMGLKVGPGPGGGASVLRADGKPASSAEVAELQRRLAREPLAQMQRPDFHQVIPRDKFAELRSHYATKPELRETTFKDVAATAEVRDFQWSRTCTRLDGNCNPNATQGSYAKGRFVAPEDLKNMSADAAARLTAEAPKAAAKEEKPRARRSKEFWERLQKEDEEFQKKLAQEEASRGGAAAPSKGGGKSRLSALLAALSGALGAGGGSQEDAAAAEPGFQPDEPASYDGAPSAGEAPADGARRASDMAAMRGMPQELPAPSPGADARRAALWSFMAGLAFLLGVFVRRRLKEREAD
ncbi:MAG: hypothetical protein SF051_03395 [Elusimicrobiota bacterium]|nr:hypothetical protein [Elusimicrobiota bacterium]